MNYRVGSEMLWGVKMHTTPVWEGAIISAVGWDISLPTGSGSVLYFVTISLLRVPSFLFFESGCQPQAKAGTIIINEYRYTASKQDTRIVPCD